MNSLFVTMQAQAAGSGWSSLLMIAALFVVMYFFMIRPQQKKQKELAKFRSSLQKGDKVLTAGGIYGTVKDVKEATVTMEIANDINIKIDKVMVMRDPSDMAR
ncbi:MAG: preprotein translocase subunit YajC [Bacteroidetes bacterium]|nr:preprotein translocase subunit YajC [Bacteroidota bacterium]